MSKLFLEKPLREYREYEVIDLSEDKPLREYKKYDVSESNIDLSDLVEEISFNPDKGKLCLQVKQEDDKTILCTTDCIGIDWLSKEKDLFIQVEPKIDNIDYLEMLLSCFKYPEIVKQLEKSYEIKFKEPFIEIECIEDRLTPLLVVHFLEIVGSIVRKGLRKSFYKTEANLNSKIKGKINISKTIKENIFKNRPLHTYCSYEVFGVNGIENKVIKKALIFCQRYLPAFPEFKKKMNPMLSYCLSAFKGVDENIEITQLKSAKANPFYKEYTTALELSQMILRKFGYNIKNTERKEFVKTPPFWISMNKLFELYVWGLLIKKYEDSIIYQAKGNIAKTGSAKVDFLFIDEEDKKKVMIIDAKYKGIYNEDKNSRKYNIDDIRQLSGYARDRKILNKLGIEKESLVDCLIIYPNQNAKEELGDLLEERQPIAQFIKFYKLGIKLPQIEIQK